MRRAVYAVKGAVVRAWSALVRLVRLGLIRQIVTLVLFAQVVFHVWTREYDLATLALAFIIYLDLQDPHRPGRVIVLRRKR